MTIILESTLDLLVSLGKRETVEELVKSGEVKETENKIKYLKINDN